jgi:hypothetical protein
MLISGGAASAAYCGKLEEILDDGIDNNYGAWKIRSRLTLGTWDLWKYIEGPESEPPDIPALREAGTFSGYDASGQMRTVYVEGNSAEHKQKTEEAEPWMAANNLALAKIVCAVPGAQIYLVDDARYAKQAWESLRSFYQPRNSLIARRVRHQIKTFCCTSDSDVALWLTDMQRLYGTLYLLDEESLSDRNFALAILDNMPLQWHSFVSDLRTKVQDSKDDPPITPHSIEVINAIRHECWLRNQNNPQPDAHVSSARAGADGKKSQKRFCSSDDASTSSSAKRPRTLSNKFCTNPHCGAPNGHTFSDCVAYGGGNQGQYGPRWRGRWNIHLPPEQRTKANNVPPMSHPAYATWTRK